MRRLAAPALLLALVGARAEAETPAAVASFDYLYIRAHENNATGGHAAIRFGAATYDFQNADSWLTVRREDSRRFQHSYRTVENRSIEVSRIEAAPETVALLHETFERRVLAQSRQLALLGEMQRDVAALDALAQGEEARVPVRGAGFFADAEAGSGAPAVLVELRERIAARHGAGWLEGRREAALLELRDRTPASPDPDALRVDPLRYPVARESFVRRSTRALAALRASEVILRPRPLRAGVRAGEGLPPDPWLRLDPALRARLLEVRAGLLDAAVALAASERPDWGEALLLASARLVALDESLASGQLVMLDAFPADAEVLRVGSRRRALFSTLLGEARRDFVEAHQCLFSKQGYREVSWNELEQAVTRIAELRAAQAGASSMRVAVRSLLPEGLAQLELTPPPTASRPEIAQAAEAARGALSTYRNALEARYRYNLLDRNCVSELFRTIEAGLASAPGAPAAADRAAIRDFVRQESERRLGGYVDPVADANFIPFVSSRNVRASWRVAQAIHLPSAREHAIETVGGIAAALRESNVWTSSVYAPAEDDGFFLFFTDGEWPLRPLLGAANLVAALARSAVGVVELPFDRGRGLRAGLGGALWSAPELLFVNIRKGTNEYVPPAQRPPVD
jgi:hypothetical protein